MARLIEPFQLKQWLEKLKEIETKLDKWENNFIEDIQERLEVVGLYRFGGVSNNQIEQIIRMMKKYEIEE